MSVDVQHLALFRFSCIVAAFAVLSSPASVFAAGLRDSGLQSGTDHYLHDTYYVTADADRLARLAALAICHLVAAAGCAILAGARSIGYFAGWVFAASAAAFVLAQSLPGIALSLMPMPQRYVDYFENSPIASLGWLFAGSQYASYVALIGMAAGWLMLVFSARRRPEI